MVLLRRLLGEVLRRHRTRQERTLRDVSAAAGVSLGYLSEVERGRKEASSELLAAICTALDVPLADVLREVSDELAREDRRLRLSPVGFGSSASLGPSRPVAPVRPAGPATVRPVAGVPPLRPGVPPLRPGVPSRATTSPDRPRTRPVTPVSSLAVVPPQQCGALPVAAA